MSWLAHNFLGTQPTRHLPCLRRTLATSSRLLDATEPQAIKPLDSQAIPSQAKKEAAIPPLNRPLGVKQRPTIVERSTKDKMKDLLDNETRMAQRRHLIKEAGKGYFHDLNMTRKHGGKTWIAPKVLIREDVALFLPNISGKCLKDGEKKDTTTLLQGKISVLAMIGTRISETHTQSFANSAYARYSSNPHFQYVQINLQENLLKSLLVKIFSNNLRNSVPLELQDGYLVSSQNMEYLRDPLGMTNSKVGYVYLVDENLKIRWGGCADATLKEAMSLERCTGVLLKRIEDSQAGKTAEVSSTPEAESGSTLDEASKPSNEATS